MICPDNFLKKEIQICITIYKKYSFCSSNFSKKEIEISITRKLMDKNYFFCSIMTGYRKR